MNRFYVIPPNEWYFASSGDVSHAAHRAATWFEENGSYDGAEAVIEEFVRQWVLRELIVTYGYPEAWLGKRIILEEAVQIGSTKKEADISIKNDSGRTYVYIEVKSYGVKREQFRDAEAQLESYLSATHTATLGMVTDGLTTRAIRKKIDPNDFEYVKDIPKFDQKIQSSRVQLVWDPNSYSSEEKRGKTGLKPLDFEYEQLLFSCHSVIRDNDGLHADEALDEICKVLYAKIYDETTTIESNGESAFRFQTYGAANSSEVASNVRALYQEARDRELETYSQRIPGYERSRGVFKKEIVLSDFTLFRIVEILQDYSIRDSDTDVKGRAFQRLLAPAVRAGMGQYFTPDPIVQLAVQILRPQISDLIMDPFCGSAHFLTSALRYVEREYAAVGEKSLYEFKFFHLHGIEKSDRMVRIAMTDMMLHDDGRTNIRNVDALLPFDNYPDLQAINTSSASDSLSLPVFDKVLTNPPFGSKISEDAMINLGYFSLAVGRKNTPVEYLGLERSVQLLKPGGMIAIVLPEHIFKGKTTRFVRSWIADNLHVRAIFFFPEDAFAPYGALVKTCLLVGVKRENGATALSSDADVFLCEIENLGYDATGRWRDGVEIDNAVAAYFDFWGDSQ